MGLKTNILATLKLIFGIKIFHTMHFPTKLSCNVIEISGNAVCFENLNDFASSVRIFSSFILIWSIFTSIGLKSVRKKIKLLKNLFLSEL